MDQVKRRSGCSAHTCKVKRPSPSKYTFDALACRFDAANGPERQTSTSFLSEAQRSALDAALADKQTSAPGQQHCHTLHLHLKTHLVAPLGASLALQQVCELSKQAALLMAGLHAGQHGNEVTDCRMHILNG